MLVDRKVLFSLLVGCVLLPKYTKQQKPVGDCPNGQYWSQHFISEGVGGCVHCPPNLKTCKAQQLDEQRCLRACGKQMTSSTQAPLPKPESTSTVKPLPTFIPTSGSYKAPQSILSTVVYTSEIPRLDVNKVKNNGKSPDNVNRRKSRDNVNSGKSPDNVNNGKSPGNVNHRKWKQRVVVIVVCVLGFCLLIALLALYWYARRQNMEGNRVRAVRDNAGENKVLLPGGHPPIKDSEVRRPHVEDSNQATFC